MTASEATQPQGKIVGWGIVAACTFATAACAVMLAKVI